MFTVLKRSRKNNAPPHVGGRVTSKGAAYYAAPLGIALLCVLILTIMFLMRQDGKHEAKIAFEAGRYIEVYPESDKIVGNLLLPVPKEFAPSPNALPNVVPPSEGAASSASLAGNEKLEVNEKDVKLNPAPNMAIAEKSTEALLPIISSDGVKPWQYYARPFTSAGNAANISVVITGLGISSELSTAATKLPPEISLSISPYTKNAAVWMASMRALGHEFLLDLPLEPSNYPVADPGPLALMTSIMPDENMQYLKSIMQKTTGFVGLIVPADEVFFAGEKDFVQPVVKEVADRGILLAFAKPQDRPALASFMKDAGTVNLGADIFVRYGSDENDIKQQLSAIEAVALKRGRGLIVIQASPIAMQAIQSWAEKLNGRGFRLAPVSALARERFS